MPDDEAYVLQQVARINQNFRRVVDECEAAVYETLLTQAALVATEIRGLAPVDETAETPGALRESVRLEEGTRRDGRKAVLIKAGGELTRKPTANGKGFYDYARAVVFGTVNQPAFDFFFAPWRARKKDVRTAIRKSIKDSVRKAFK
jgi:hypothetical protein